MSCGAWSGAAYGTCRAFDSAPALRRSAHDVAPLWTSASSAASATQLPVQDVLCSAEQELYERMMSIIYEEPQYLSVLLRMAELTEVDAFVHVRRRCA